MEELPIVKQGESFDFSFTLDDVSASIDGWVCTIFVKVYPYDTPVINRVITPTGDVWSGFLTQTETATLPLGLHYLAAKLTKAATDEEQHKEKRFQVSKNWITP